MKLSLALFVASLPIVFSDSDIPCESWQKEALLKVFNKFTTRIIRKACRNHRKSYLIAQEKKNFLNYAIEEKENFNRFLSDLYNDIAKTNGNLFCLIDKSTKSVYSMQIESGGEEEELFNKFQDYIQSINNMIYLKIRFNLQPYWKVCRMMEKKGKAQPLFAIGQNRIEIYVFNLKANDIN
ncbi:MAG: hypothetical protein MHMPM18_000518 [Marteilia pararefringens]